MHFKYPILIIVLYLLCFSGFGQERISIEDPELTFSYDRPAGWESQDEPLYHYIIKAPKYPDTVGSQISITYYDGSCNDLDECFEAEEKGSMPSVIKHFKKIASGEEQIDGTTAKWIKFSGFLEPNIDDRIRGQYGFFFIKENQYFVLRIILDDGDSEAEKEALSIVRSLAISKL